MWNKRKEEVHTQTPKPTYQQGPVEPAKEGIPVSPTPMKSVESDLSRSATIGKNVTIKGQIYSREDLMIDGEIEGSIELQEHRLTVGPNGKVSAGIKAREIVVLGSVLGNVEALDKIDIRKDARLVGDIKTARIIIEDGAYFKGSIDIVKAETPKPAAPRPQQAAPVSPSPNAAPIAASGSAGR